MVLGLISSIRCKNVEWILERSAQQNILSTEVGVCSRLLDPFPVGIYYLLGRSPNPAFGSLLSTGIPTPGRGKKECVNLVEMPWQMDGWKVKK